jgi:cold shock CspA family protein
MAKSQQTFGKKEREKKRLKKREEKQKKKDERKANSTKGMGLDNFSYVDEYGNITDTPPDPTKKVKVDVEDIVLGIPKKEESEEDNETERKGKVEFFNDSKGYGFILDTGNQEKYFVHASGLIDQIQEGDKVVFELEKGMKGMNAVNVKKS